MCIQSGTDRVVPLAVEFVLHDSDRVHFGVRDRFPDGVFPTVQCTSHLQSPRSRRLRDQPNDDFIIRQGFAAPVRADKREEPMFDLVPLAGARRKVTHENGQLKFIRQALQLAFPEAKALPIAAAAIGRNKKTLGLGDRGGVLPRATSLEPTPRRTAPYRDPFR